MEVASALLHAAVLAAVPLLLAGTGEMVAEKSGVLNLGVEGMMLVGAVAGFIVAFNTGDTATALAAAMLAGSGMAALFAVLTVLLRANQVASGLALTIFGTGLSAFVGQPHTGKPLEPPPILPVPGLSDLPLVGRGLFSHDALVYGAFAALAATAWFLNRTRWGLALRAIGDNHDAARALGYPVTAVRFAAVLFGGAMAGAGGAYLSLAYSPLWAENMTAGRGWIALALVVFSAWRPGRLLIGAGLFGLAGALELFLQAAGASAPSQFLAMAPYLATIIALAFICGRRGVAAPGAPACLGRPLPV